MKPILFESLPSKMPKKSIFSTKSRKNLFFTLKMTIAHITAMTIGGTPKLEFGFQFGLGSNDGTCFFHQPNFYILAGNLKFFVSKSNKFFFGAISMKIF